MSKMKLAIIFGGKSSEYPVSLHSAGSLIHQINKERYDLMFVGISKDGTWYAYDGDIESIEHDTWLNKEHCKRCILSCSSDDKGFFVLNNGSYVFSLYYMEKMEKMAPYRAYLN